MTVSYASLSRSTSASSARASSAQRAPAACIRATSSSLAARDVGSPATIANNDAPIAPASAEADPPPGVGSELRKAARRSVTGRALRLIKNDVAFLDDGFDRGRADANQIYRIAGHEDGVHRLAGLEAARSAVAVERVGAVDRRRDERLLEREAHAEAGERHRKRHRRRKPSAGVDVGRERDGDARVDQ